MICLLNIKNLLLLKQITRGNEDDDTLKQRMQTGCKENEIVSPITS